MKQDQRSRIVEAAFDEWSKTRYTNTSLNLVASRLGVTKQSLYRHFAGKAGLVNAMVDALRVDLERASTALENAREFAHPAAQTSKSAMLENVLGGIATAQLDFIRRNPNYYMFLTMYIPRIEAGLRSSIFEIAYHQHGIIRESLRSLICPTASEQDWEVILFHITSATTILSSFHFWSLDGKRLEGPRLESDEQFAEAVRGIVRILCHGLFPTSNIDLDFDNLDSKYSIGEREMPEVHRILSAVEETVSEYGIELASLERIAQKIGISKSSLYFYFENKDEMFEKMIRHEQSAFNDLYRKKSRDTTRGEERMYGYMVMLTSYFIRNQALISMFEWLRYQRIHIRFNARSATEDPREFLEKIMDAFPAGDSDLSNLQRSALVSAMVLGRISSARTRYTYRELLSSIRTIYQLLARGISGSFLGKEQDPI